MSEDPSEVVVLGFGDSLTAGTPGYDPHFGGDNKSQYGFWLTLAARDMGIPVQFDNRGVPGDLVASMLSRLQKTLLMNRYDVAIIVGGTNDLGWGQSPTKILALLEKLWFTCLESVPRLVVSTIPPIRTPSPMLDSARNELNNMILDRVGTEPNTIAVDLFTAMSDESGLLRGPFDSGDGLHFSVKGYQRMGEVLWEAGVKQLLGA
ncbi:MAG: hypothetical protein BAJATHORv1_70103 [Candidatus Thorarchaeota archaeon]|nr:MAG: hypothetical protein BAJATHORv1_70103 [Candidatus Thorarchaeota archaeon]